MPKLLTMQFIVAAALSCGACSRQIGDFTYNCSKGGILDSYCEADLPGPYALLSIDGASPHLYIEFEGGGGIGAIQGKHAKYKLQSLGINDYYVVAILATEIVYLADRSEQSAYLKGPYSLANAKRQLGEKWPIMKRVQ